MSENMFSVVKYDAGGVEIKLEPETVKNYLVRGNGKVTDQEVLFFIRTCQAQKLNPLVYGEVYLIKFGNEPAQLVIGKETYMKRAFKNPNYNGMKSGIVVQRGEEIVQKEGTCLYPSETLLGGWCSLDQSITDGTTAKNELQQKIAEAGKLSADMMEAKNNLAGLTEKNAEAVRNIDALDAKIKTAGSSGTLLEKQTQAADAVNTTLEGTIRTADTSKTALENATVVAGDTKQLLSQKITEARSTIDDITAAKGSLAQAGFEAQKVVETVNQSAQNATAAKAALDNTIKSSAESKAALAGSITESGVAINKVNDAIRAAGVAVEETVAATNETKKTTEEAKNADTKLSQSASDANALKTALDAVVGSVAQNATAEEIARILQTNSTLLAQIAESAGKAGSLNGFGLNLLQDGSVSLTYSNPDTGELQGSAIFPKESTLSALDQALAEMNVSLKKIAISKGGTV